MGVAQFSQELARYLENLYQYVLDCYGMDVDLYIPDKATDDTRETDIYNATPARTYNAPNSGSPYKVKAYINWAPDLYRLKKIGLYVEGAPPPILARVQLNDLIWKDLGYKGALPIWSYIVVPIQYLPATIVETAFDIVNVRSPHLHGQIESIVLYDLAPRRKQT